MRKIMLFREFNEYEGSADHIDWGYISSSLDQIKDLISNIEGEGGEIAYSWERKGDVGIVVTVVRGEMAKTFDYDVDQGTIKKVSNGVEEVVNVDSLEHGIEEIENGLNEIIGDQALIEKVKAQRYKGRKIPGKYLTKNPGKMKKEIDRFVGKKEYKKDWNADYNSGKGGEGKRVKTKKSAATKAYQRMFGDKEK
jgi:hypothetical protein